MADDYENDEDIYSEEGHSEQLREGSIEPQEQGFMEGYETEYEKEYEKKRSEEDEILDEESEEDEF